MKRLQAAAHVRKKKPKMQIKKRRKNMDAANKRRIKLKPSLKFSYPPIAGPVALKLTFSIINIEINNGNLISSHLYFFPTNDLMRKFTYKRKYKKSLLI